MVRRKQAARADIKIRMKEPLRAKIEAAAKRRGVSMNAEMVSRLEQSFQKEGASDELQMAVDGLNKRLDELGFRISRDGVAGFLSELLRAQVKKEGTDE